MVRGEKSSSGLKMGSFGGFGRSDSLEEVSYVRSIEINHFSKLKYISYRSGQKVINATSLSHFVV